LSRREDESLVSPDELASVLRSHEGPPGPVTNGAGNRLARATRPRSVRRVAVLGGAVAIALLVGSAFGFGLGSTVTPTGTARSNAVGFGFLPARGWNVVQSGSLRTSGTSTAIAANIPLDQTRQSDDWPVSNLASLPARGILLAATFSLRGDPGEDFKFPVSALPLRFASASPALVSEARSEYRLRAGVGGYNVDARIYFGSAEPSIALQAEAQNQLNRLVVAAERVTIAARPPVAPSDNPVTLFGSIDSGKAGESIEIQARDCGQQFFRAVAGATTGDGGGWSLEYRPLITTTLRAVWKDSASPQITVRQRAMLRFVPKPGNRTRFVVSVVARAQFWKRKVTIQRFDRRLGRWAPFRSVVLTDQEAAGTLVWTSGEFTARLPRGTRLRAVLPASQAGPCYLSGTSLVVRT
jgi:hypothetical protein